MDVHQAQIKKEELEKKVKDLIDEFEMNTQLVVERIYWDVMITQILGEAYPTRRGQVRITARLKERYY
jgi:hypothetical protein